MDNIEIKKNWEDTDIFEIKVNATSKFISMYQFCYIQSIDLYKKGQEIIGYTENSNEYYYVEFGKIKGNFTPAFSLKFFPSDSKQKVKIEVNMEIDDNEERAHRSIFFIHSELYKVKNFGSELIKMSENKLSDKVISLN